MLQFEQSLCIFRSRSSLSERAWIFFQKRTIFLELGKWDQVTFLRLGKRIEGTRHFRWIVRWNSTFSHDFSIVKLLYSLSPNFSHTFKEIKSFIKSENFRKQKIDCSNISPPGQLPILINRNVFITIFHSIHLKNHLQNECHKNRRAFSNHEYEYSVEYWNRKLALEWAHSSRCGW